jgi:peptidoglycan/xylan/chitin deacetylase (PgdA/CDA1 family)
MLESRARGSDASIGAAIVFHGLAERTRSSDSELLPALGAREFAQHVSLIASRYRPVRASELVDGICARAAGKPIPVALTFDDDLASHRTLALPALQRAGVVATFFVGCPCGAQAPWWRSLQRLVDRRDELRSASPQLDRLVPRGQLTVHEWATVITDLPASDRRRVQEELARAAGSDRGALSRNDLEAIAAADMEIGYHTRHHDALPALGDAQLRAELSVSGPRRPTAISYPHGRADRRVAAAAHDAGFTVGFTTAARAIRGTDDPLLLGRIGPSLHSVSDFAYALARLLLPDEA